MFTRRLPTRATVSAIIDGRRRGRVRGTRAPVPARDPRAATRRRARRARTGRRSLDGSSTSCSHWSPPATWVRTSTPDWAPIAYKRRESAAVTLASTATRTSGQGSTPAGRHRARATSRKPQRWARPSAGSPPMNALVLRGSRRSSNDFRRTLQTGRFAPLTNDAASLARNATTLPTSAGSPSRRSGVLRATISRAARPARSAYSLTSIPGMTRS